MAHAERLLVVVSKDDRVLRVLGAFGPQTSVEGFASAEEARSHLHRADVVVIDLVSNGFSLVSDIRDSSWGSDVRIVMLCERPHDVWLCLEAGADQVLVKPLSDPTAVSRAIEGPPPAA